jgi:RHS repeat-associated protein
MSTTAPPRVRAPRAPVPAHAPAAHAPGGNGTASGPAAAGDGGGGEDGGSRSVPVPARAPAPPLISSPTGFAPADCVADAINAVAAPFQQGPDPALGTAGAVAHWTGAALGVVGAVQNIVDTGVAALTAPLAKLWPSQPAVTLGVLHVGTPHTHVHPPSLVPPAPPIPLPSLGMLVGSGAVTVLVSGMPAARAGDVGIGVTCGTLAPPFEVYTGSSNVFIGGARAARAGDITKHCNPSSMGPFAIAMGALGVVAGGAGAIAKNDSFAMAQAAADAAVLAMKLLCGKDPSGPPGIGALTVPFNPSVMIGGFPCPPVGEMAFGGILKALQKAARGLKKKFSSKRNNTTESNCGDPVDPVTGEVFAHYTDFVSSGLFRWRRYYSTAHHKERGPLGKGWRHFYQRRLRRRLHHATYIDWEGNRVEFPRFEYGSNVTRSDGYVLERLAPGYFEVSRRGEPAMQFVGGEFDSELTFHRMLSEDGEIEFEHDVLGRLVAAIETDSEGKRRRFEITYTDGGRVEDILERELADDGNLVSSSPVPRVTHRYESWGGLKGVTNAVGGVSHYEYDGFDRMTRQSDACKYSFQYRYDTLGRCIETRGQDGMLECRLEYFPDDKYTRMTEAGDATWEFHYDDDGVVTKIVDPYGGVKKRELDGEGRMAREVDSGGRELHWLYDENGVHYARRDRFGYVYPPASEMPTLPNPLAPKLPTTSLGWLLDGIAPVRPEAALGLDIRQLDIIPNAPKSYARAFRICEHRSDDEITRTSFAARLKYDALGHPISEVDTRGRERRWEYDAEGHRVAECDRDGNVTREAIVSWKSVGMRVDGERRAMHYEYSRRDEVTKITDPLGLESEFEYDLKGRLARVRRHGRIREEYVYDSGDHFIEKRDGQGRVLFTNQTHDNHFVATRVLASGGTHAFDYDASGRVTRASTDAHQIELAYDSGGHRILDRRDGLGVEHAAERGPGAFGDPRLWRTRLFERFELTRQPCSASTFRLTDSAGRQTHIEIGERGLVTRYASNGTVELLQYDEEGRLEGHLCHRRDRFARQVAWAVHYEYSGEGDLLRVSDSVRGDSTYEVDASHRLIAERTPDGTLHRYAQDAAGNLLERPGHIVRALSSGNRLSASAGERFAYDDRDHLAERTQKDGSTIRYVYDSFDMLVRIEHGDATLTWPPRFGPPPDVVLPPDGSAPRLVPGQTWRAAYDALGRRLWTEFGSRRREFYWDGDRLAAELFPDGKLRIYQYSSATALVPLTFTDYADRNSNPATGKSYHVFTDPVGMPLSIEDEEGQIVWWAHRADPYGLVAVRSDAKIEYNLRWPGHYFDAETGLHYNRHRYYDPKLGRYLQCDPTGYAGSPVNLYAYCKNPLVHVDVLGLHDPDDTKPPQPSEQGPTRTGQEGAATTPDTPPPRPLGMPPRASDVSGGKHASDRPFHDVVSQASSPIHRPGTPQHGQRLPVGRWSSPEATQRAAAKVDPTLGRQVVPLDSGDGTVVHGGVQSYPENPNAPSHLEVPSDKALAIPQGDGTVHIFPIDETHYLYEGPPGPR